jgi:putative alpha-1,2-mannosidase
MKKKIIFAILIITLVIGTAFAGCIGYKKKIVPQQPKDLSKYVNPFIGTDASFIKGAAPYGNTFPGAVVPFGMVQISPDRGRNNAGYHYKDQKIEGFSHTHLGGSGCPLYGNILIMPAIGELKVNREGFTVAPHDHDTKAELTATERCGFHRYTFPDSKNSHILVNASHVLDSLVWTEKSI